MSNFILRLKAEKCFELIKMIKKLKFKGYYGNLQKNICSCRQSSTIYLKESKDIMQKWTRAEDFGNRVRIDFDRY